MQRSLPRLGNKFCRSQWQKVRSICPWSRGGLTRGIRNRSLTQVDGFFDHMPGDEVDEVR